MNDNNVVLACIRNTETSPSVCDYASWISKRTCAPIKLLHTIVHPLNPVINDFSGSIGLGAREDLLNEFTSVEQKRSRILIEKGQALLSDAKLHIQKANSEIKPETCQRHGSLIESLIDLEDKIRVLIIGIRKSPEKSQEEISTQLESVIRALHKPILITNKEYSEPKTIMLAYDGSKSCRLALDMYCSSPLFKGLPCHIVHVGENGQGLLEEAKTILDEKNIEAKISLIQGKPAEALAKYQVDNDIDLMLMGAFSHNKFRELLLGSFTAQMLEKTNRPLLLLR